jgi:hypothetical protein
MILVTSVNSAFVLRREAGERGDHLQQLFAMCLCNNYVRCQELLLLQPTFLLANSVAMTR